MKFVEFSQMKKRPHGRFHNQVAGTGFVYTERSVGNLRPSLYETES